MAKALNYLLIALYISFGVVGYLIFGPPSHTHVITNTPFFRNKLAPFVEKFLTISGQETVIVGYLSKLSGDVSYRPPSELVFLPAHEGQPIYSGTLFITSDDSNAHITLIDNSSVNIESNSTILLDAPSDYNLANATITLKVIVGTVAARKQSSSATQVKIITAKGLVRNVSDDKKTVVLAQRKTSLPASTISGSDLSHLDLEEDDVDEIVGTAKESTDLKELEKTLFERSPVISARVRAATQKIATKTPEKDFNLEELGKLTTALDVESKKSVQQSSPNAPQEEARRSQLIPASVISSAAKSEALPKEFLDELAKAPEIAPVPIFQETKIQATGKNTSLPESDKQIPLTGKSKLLPVKVSEKNLSSKLANRSYSSTEFTEATQLAADGLFDAYLLAKDCKKAKETLNTVFQGFSHDKKAIKWKDRKAATLTSSCP